MLRSAPGASPRWDPFAWPLTKMRNAKQSVLNLVKLFPIGGGGLAKYLNELALPSGFDDRSGHRIQVFIDTANGRRLDIPEPVEHSGGNTRLSVYFLKGFSLDQGSIETRQVSVRIDVPWRFVDGHATLERYTLYNIRFALPEGAVPDNMVRPLFSGYFGITKRHPFERFSEHQRDMRSGGGYALHTAWRALRQCTDQYSPVIQISGTHEDLKGIYALEEEAVARTLAPLGLNTIPGGEAGIRMLHQLGLTNKLKLGVDERDALLAKVESPNGPCAHYRRGHLRKLATKSVWVSPCWVALKEIAA